MYTAVKAGEHQIVAEIIASDGSVQIPRQTQTQRHAATPRSEADMQESGPEKHSIREPPAWRQSLQNTDDLLGQTWVYNRAVNEPSRSCSITGCRQENGMLFCKDHNITLPFGYNLCGQG